MKLPPPQGNFEFVNIFTVKLCCKTKPDKLEAIIILIVPGDIIIKKNLSVLYDLQGSLIPASQTWLASNQFLEVIENKLGLSWRSSAQAGVGLYFNFL